MHALERRKSSNNGIRVSPLSPRFAARLPGLVVHGGERVAVLRQPVQAARRSVLDGALGGRTGRVYQGLCFSCSSFLVSAVSRFFSLFVVLF